MYALRVSEVIDPSLWPHIAINKGSLLLYRVLELSGVAFLFETRIVLYDRILEFKIKWENRGTGEIGQLVNLGRPCVKKK